MISVIVPVYNCEKYVADAINSVICQTNQEYELLIILNGCTDSSMEICQSFLCKENIKIFSLHDANVSLARNYGIERACGEYLLFLDADDMLNKYCIETLNAFIQKAQADIVSFEFRQFKGCEEDSDHLPNKGNSVFFSGESLEKEKKKFLLDRSSLKKVVCGNLYNSKLVKKLRFHEDIYIGEDFCFQLEAIMRAKNIVFCEKPLYYNRMTTDSLSRSYINKKTLENIEKTNQYKADFIQKNYPQYEEQVFVSNFMHTFSWINRAIGENNKSAQEILEREANKWWEKVKLKKHINIKKRAEYMVFVNWRNIYQIVIAWIWRC